jgi:hypothetical protein
MLSCIEKYSTDGGIFAPEYVDTLSRLSAFKIKTIYSGYDEPACHNTEEIIRESLRNVRSSEQ